MRAIARLALFIAGLFLLVFALWETGFTQGGEYRYFWETGHAVEGAFYVFYHRTPNPELVYGYPITEAYMSPDLGVLVQYFQRARFEFDPTAPVGQRVQLTPLGEFMYQPGERVPLSYNPSTCSTFADSRYPVCYSFLRFFNLHGGVESFGKPISGVELHDGRIVQYFERARFEWYPEDASLGQDVRLSDLGRMFFYKMGEDPGRLRAVSPSNVARRIERLQMYAFPASAVVLPNGPLSLYVIAQDQNREPVSGVQVSIALQFPSGRVESYLLGPTNESGIVSATIPFRAGEGDLGLVEVYVRATLLNMQAGARTSFRISR